MKKLRSQVGLVFQYPENQLFETDVLTDVCFGPKNQGLSQEEAQKEARWALEQVRLGEDFGGNLPLNSPGDRSVGRRSPGSWPCILRCWCWTNRPPDWIRRDAMRSWI